MKRADTDQYEAETAAVFDQLAEISDGLDSDIPVMLNAFARWINAQTNDMGLGLENPQSCKLLDDLACQIFITLEKLDAMPPDEN